MFKKNNDEQLQQLLNQIGSSGSQTQTQPSNLFKPVSSSGSNPVNIFANSMRQQSEAEISHVQNQIGHYKQRLNIAGFDADDVGDSRNKLEKALNLTPDQHWFFDILELTNRPFQAIGGVVEEGTNKQTMRALTQNELQTMSQRDIDEYQEKRDLQQLDAGGKMITGFWKGLSGQEKYTGKQISSNVFGDGSDQSEEGFNAHSASGFFIEMLLDPVRWATMAATGGASEAATATASLGKGAAKTLATGGTVPVEVSKDLLKGIGKGTMLGRGSKTLSDIGQGTKTLTEATQGAKTLLDTMGTTAKAAETIRTGMATSAFTSIKNADFLTKQADTFLAGIEGAAKLKKLDKMPQVLGDITKLLTGQQVTGRLDKIRGAKTVIGKVAHSGGLASDALGKISNPNWWVTSTEFNRNHVTVLNKAIGKSVEWLGKGTKFAFKAGESKYMDHIGELKMSGDPAMVKIGDDKLNQYHRVTDSFNKLLSKTPKFVKTARDATEAQKEIIGNKTLNTYSKYLTEYDEIVPDLIDAEFIDASTGKAVKYFNSREDIDRMIYELTETKISSVEKDLSSFMRDMAYKSGSGNVVPSSTVTDETFERLFKGSPERFGVTRIGEKGETWLFDDKIWNTQNIHGLRQDILRANPLAGDEMVKLGLEMSKDTETLLKNLKTDPNLESFKTLYESFGKSLETIQSTIGSEAFNDPAYILSQTKSIHEGGFIPHEIDQLDANYKKFIEFTEFLKELGDPSMQPEQADFVQKATDALAEFENSGLVGTELAGDTRTIGARNMIGTVFQKNKTMRDYLLNTYENPEIFARMFPNATAEHQAQMVDIIKDLKWFHQDTGQSLLDLGFNIGESSTKVAFKTQIALGETFSGIDGKFKGLQILEKGDTVPIGVQRFSKEDAQKLLYSLKQSELYTDAPALESLIAHLEIGIDRDKRIFIDSDIERYVSQVTRQGPDEFLNLLNSKTNDWKKMKVLSPAYQARNVTGNLYNATASGIPIGDVLGGVEDARLSMNAIGSVGDEGTILWKYASGMQLNPWERNVFETYTEMRRGGFLDNNMVYRLEGIEAPESIKGGKDIQEAFRRKSATEVPRWGEDPERTAATKIGKFYNKTVGKTLDKASEINMNLNQAFDDMSRWSTYSYAKNNPDYLLQLGVETPIDAVRRVHFDVNNLTNIEDKVLKKIVPFYNFNRQNIEFQLRNMMNNPDQFRDFVKKIDFVWEAFDINPAEDMQDWERENFNLPSPLSAFAGEGKYRSMKTNLPVSDVLDYATPMSAVKSFVSSLNPAIRAPFELVSGKKMFSDRDIADEGVLDYLKEATGWDVPLRLPEAVGGAIKGAATGDYDGVLRAIEKAGGLTHRGDAVRNRQTKEYDELNRLKEFFEELRELGIELPTITELRRSGIIK